jgi:hypothetical protein
VTTYTHDWRQQAITSPPLMSTIHKSPQHPLSPFQPAVSLLGVPRQLLLIVEILQLHAFRFCLRSIPCRTEMNFVLLVVTSRHGPHRKHLMFCACMLPASPSNGHCLRSHRLARDLFATICKTNMECIC